MGRGWGVRTLHDLPVGTFISVYSGEIFTSEQADERGKLLGDEYQADLDFFEVSGRCSPISLTVLFEEYQQRFGRGADRWKCRRRRR